MAIAHLRGILDNDQNSFDSAFLAGDSPAIFVPQGGGASGGSSQTVTFGNITFNNTYTANCTAAYINCILLAEQTIGDNYTNSFTLNLTFDAQAKGTNGTFLATNNWAHSTHVTFTQLVNALTNIQTLEPDNLALWLAVANLPTQDPSGGAGFSLPGSYARMLGLNSSSPAVDDTVTLNTSYNWTFGQDVVNAITHEISEGGLGRVGGLGDQNSQWDTMDLFRYNSSGVGDYTDGRDGQKTFFSYDGGLDLSSLQFNNEYNSSGTKVNSGDTADFTTQDVFGTGNTGETNTLSNTDFQVLDVLGWNPAFVALTATQADSAYLAVLQRNGSTNEIANFLAADNSLGHAAAIFNYITNSPEAQFNVYPIIQIIVLATGFYPTAEQLAGWVPYIEQNGFLQGQSQTNPLLDSMAFAFVASDMFGHFFNNGVDVDPNSLVTAQEMQKIIPAATGLAATQTQINNWVNTNLTVDQVFVDFSLGDQYTAFLKTPVQQFLTAAAYEAVLFNGGAAASTVGIENTVHST